MKLRGLCLAVLATALSVAISAQAAFHVTQVEQIIGGVGGVLLGLCCDMASILGRTPSPCAHSLLPCTFSAPHVALHRNKPSPRAHSSAGANLRA